LDGREVKSKIEPISDWVRATVRNDLSPAAQQRAIADFARGRLAEAQETNRRVLGRVPPHTVAVDGRPGAAFETVRPKGGTIVVEFEIITDVLIWIATALAERSPVVSGEYRRGHTLFADGIEVDVGGVIPDAAEYSFTNLVPYARKIEIGTTKSGRPFVLQVQNRIYERTAKDARSRFGNIARIGFTFRGIVGGRQYRAGAAGRAHNKSDVRYPTITVTSGRGY